MIGNFRYPPFQRITYLILFILQLTLLLATLFFLPRDYWTFLVGLTAFQVFMLFRLTISLLQSWTTYQILAEGLVEKRPFHTRQWDLNELQEIRYFPGRGKLILRFSARKLAIPNSLQGFRSLFSVLQEKYPSTTPSRSHLPLEFRVVRGVWPFYYFFLLVIGLFTLQIQTVVGNLWEGSGLLIGFPLLFLSLTIVLRSLFFSPVAYHVFPDFIRVHYLLRRKIHYYDHVISSGTDLYAHGGGEYFLYKILFQNGNVILDELFLDWEVRPTVPCLARHFFVRK